MRVQYAAIGALETDQTKCIRIYDGYFERQRLTP